MGRGVRMVRHLLLQPAHARAALRVHVKNIPGVDEEDRPHGGDLDSVVCGMCGIRD